MKSTGSKGSSPQQQVELGIQPAPQREGAGAEPGRTRLEEPRYPPNPSPQERPEPTATPLGVVRVACRPHTAPVLIRRTTWRCLCLHLGCTGHQEDATKDALGQLMRLDRYSVEHSWLDRGSGAVGRDHTCPHGPGTCTGETRHAAALTWALADPARLCLPAWMVSE